MFAKDRILTLDIGASKILLSEFSAKGPSDVTLLRYAAAELDALSGESAPLSMATLGDAVRDLLQGAGMEPAPLYLTLSGQTVFPRFVKIPAATEDMVDELVTGEAAEGLPFPLDQVVWDYQTLGIGETGDLDTLIVATKQDTALDAAALAKGAGLDLELVDAGPLALYNAVRFNAPESEGCTLVLDMGAKTTNLVFLEDGKVFLRTIPVAGNTITNEIARGLGVEPAEAERIKKEVGFVALGGTYAVTDDELADRVSKIVRNVATRLHSEITRSINFYRSQQSGSAPVRVLLTGGTANLRHLDTFFQEKLGVEVALFNPFSSVSVAPELAEEQGLVFSMAPSVGLALRRAAKCPLEINLLPKDIVATRQFRRRIPFFAAAAVAGVLGICCWAFYASSLKSTYEEESAAVALKASQLASSQSALSAKTAELGTASAKESFFAYLAASRTSYAEVLGAVRAAMLPGTWIQSVSFDNFPRSESDPDAEGGEESGGPRPAGVMHLTVRGYYDGLDNLEASSGGAAAAQAGAKKKPAGRANKTAVMMLRERLWESPLFLDALPPGMPEAKSYVNIPRLRSNPLVREITVHVALARPVGVVESSWTPEVALADADGEEGAAEEEDGAEAAEEEAGEEAEEAPAAGGAPEEPADGADAAPAGEEEGEDAK